MAQLRPGSVREISQATAQESYRAVRLAGLESEVKSYAGILGYDTKDRSDWHNGNGDAFRHATVSALLTRDFGPGAAALAGTVHEAQDAYRWVKQALLHAVGADPEYQTFAQFVLETEMDFHNNALGRDPAIWEDATDRMDVARRVSSRLAAGEGQIISGGVRVPSRGQVGKNAEARSREEAERASRDKLERDRDPVDRPDRGRGVREPSIIYDDINFDVRRAGSKVA